MAYSAFGLIREDAGDLAESQDKIRGQVDVVSLRRVVRVVVMLLCCQVMQTHKMNMYTNQMQRYKTET